MAAFYLDENVALRFARLLAEHGHDMVWPGHLGTRGADDQQHLAVSARLGRILVTYNERHFRMLHRAWRDWSVEWGLTPLPSHGGIIQLPQPPILDVDQGAEVVLGLLEARGSRLANRFFAWSRAHGWREDSRVQPVTPTP